MKAKKLMSDLGAAFGNLRHALTTPRTELQDEILAKEFCQKMRAMGENPEDALQWAAMLAAAGATTDQVRVYMKISARAVVAFEDLIVLERSGVRIMVSALGRGKYGE